jgi:hypothetical protein
MRISRALTAKTNSICDTEIGLSITRRYHEALRIKYIEENNTILCSFT